MHVEAQDLVKTYPPGVRALDAARGALAEDADRGSALIHGGWLLALAAPMVWLSTFTFRPTSGPSDPPARRPTAITWRYDPMRAVRQKRFKLVPEMEGRVARWYARQRGSGSQLEEYRKQAARLTAALPDGADVLEVAPGPGYHAIEIARLGRFPVTGLDISRTFVEIAAENAWRAGVSVDFRRGDVADMPFGAESFDLIICQAAFKNFSRPGTALDEMYRALRPGGTAVIQDMRRDASGADIDREVAGMRLSGFNGFLTKGALRWLRHRAYSPARFERLAAESSFRTCDIQAAGIGMEVRLTKPA